MSDEPTSFEGILTALEAEVARLERGDLPLEDALKAFEHGMALSKSGGAILQAAERKVEVLVAARSGQAETRPLDVAE